VQEHYANSAEGGVFDIIGGRYNGNVPNLDVWLKGHSGDPIRIDRKGRPPEYIPRPALTLGLMMQPDVLKSIAAQKTFRGRGLLARFMYAMPVSKVGRRATATASMLHPNRIRQKCQAENCCNSTGFAPVRSRCRRRGRWSR
jgi:Protein of unknown function (DUF3987)